VPVEVVRGDVEQRPDPRRKRVQLSSWKEDTSTTRSPSGPTRPPAPTAPSDVASTSVGRPDARPIARSAPPSCSSRSCRSPRRSARARRRSQLDLATTGMPRRSASRSSGRSSGRPAHHDEVAAVEQRDVRRAEVQRDAPVRRSARSGPSSSAFLRSAPTTWAPWASRSRAAPCRCARGRRRGRSIRRTRASCPRSLQFQRAQADQGRERRAIQNARRRAAPSSRRARSGDGGGHAEDPPPHSLKDSTCAMTESASATNTAPTIARRNSRLMSTPPCRGPPRARGIPCRP